ncbi:MAG: hypothetical protein JO043_00245, partial [Candidatus Eremiobacteraeota bacterium]|nr:hypothetical protein [Candidatus Eremiobacteraeota bacterium]
PESGVSSSLHIKGTGSFAVPVFHGKFFRANSFTFDTLISDDYNVKIANSGQVLFADWGQFHVEGDNVVLQFSREGGGQQQDVAFDLRSTYIGLGVQGNNVGFTVHEQPPGPKVWVTEHGHFRGYVDYGRVAGYAFTLLLGVLIGHH